jgi:hypothetical protein
MRMKMLTTLPVMLVVVLAATPLRAVAWDGTVKVGGVFRDEVGDRSTVQETYNIYNGFSLSQLRFSTTPNPTNYLMIDLRDINFDNRQGELLYRRPGTFKLSASLVQNRQVFDPGRRTTSDRRNWNMNARFTPARWIKLEGGLGYITRTGSRLSYPTGTADALGLRYDNGLFTGRVSAEARKDRKVLAVDYRASHFSDERNSDADRTGQVVSARIAAPCMFYDRWTHLVRAAYGISELSTGDLDYTLSNFQYTGIVDPVDPLRVKYRFEAQRVDDETTDLKTDRFTNDIDATAFYRYGEVSLGYGYETNDDELHLTYYNSWRAATTFRYNKLLTARFQYAGRLKKDQEELTLLKDIETSRFRGDLDVNPVKGLSVGSSFRIRDRDYPDIDVTATGQIASAYAQYTYAGWGGLMGTYEYSNDEFQDRIGRFRAWNNSVTGRVDLERIKDLRLSSGLTYVNVGGDLDIQKWILSFEGKYDVREDVHVEAKYNIYNYDDYILLDRYYTGNIVWFNVAYDLHGK